MSESAQPVADHYTIDQHLEQLLESLASSGKDINHLAIDDLAALDAFHLRGRAATEELAHFAELEPGQTLLDVGSGIGGTCRYLAATFGCQATGIDLTPEFCRIAEDLTRRTGLADRVVFQCGSALELPFEDASFDVVWTEHVQMNIADKQTFYREVFRVLKPQGQFAFHDILAGSAGDLAFPVPWASDPSISHLIEVGELWMLLTEMGFDISTWEDMTEPARAFVAEVLEKMDPNSPPPVHARLPMENAGAKLANVLDGLTNDRIRAVQAVCRKMG